MTVCLGSYKNNTLKISHSWSYEFPSYLPVKFVFFLKSRLLFSVFYCFCVFVNKHFIISGVHISKNEQNHHAKPSAYHFYVKTEVSVDFYICSSVPLIILNSKQISIFFLSGNNEKGGRIQVIVNWKLAGVFLIDILELKVSSAAQKMKFCIKDFFSKCDQIRSFLRIWSHLLKKSLMENLIFCAVKT